jgi:hypothetical protein
VNSCVNSPEDGPVNPKHVEIRRYMNKIEIATSVGFSFHMLKGCTVQKLKILLYSEFLRPYYQTNYDRYLIHDKRKTEAKIFLFPI